MALTIRKICVFHEEIRIDQRDLARPFKHAVVAAVIRNPWAGQGFVEDLKPVVNEFSDRKSVV